MSTEQRLDRKRSYGLVYNDPNIGFFQDEKPYRHDGYLYVPPDTSLSALKVSDKGFEGPGVTDANMPMAVSEKLDQAFAERNRKRT